MCAMRVAAGYKLLERVLGFTHKHHKVSTIFIFVEMFMGIVAVMSIDIECMWP